MNSKQDKSTFESALLNAFKTHGLLPPMGNEDEGTTENLLPEELNNPDSFIKKETKVIPMTARSRNTKRPQYAKVAMKKGVKSKMKKKR